MQPQPKGLAITALVLGIVALVFFWLPWIAVIAGAVAVILGIIAAVKKQPKGFAITGIILGAIGFIIGLILWIAAAVFVGQIAGELESLELNEDLITIEE